MTKRGPRARKNAADSHERGYIEGRRRSLINLLQHVLAEIRTFEPHEDAILRLARCEMELQEARAKLSSLADDHDVDIKPDLYLPDLIEQFVREVT